MKRYWLCCGLAAAGWMSQSAAEAQVNYQTTQTSAPIITPISAPKTTPIGGGATGNCDSGCDSNASSCCDSVGSFRTLGNDGFFRRGGGGMLGGGLLGGGLLGGIIKPSDHCFDDFISPMTNPTHFEDPRNLTEARFIYLRHKVPQAILGGGEVNLFALQLRAAITDRLSVIATKDGYIDSNLVGNGWADLAAGLKYNLLRDPAGQGLLSIGGTYELANGSARSFQGNGNGVFNFFLSGAQKLTDRANYIGAFGVRLPRDTVAETSMMFWSHHVDRRITDRVYLLAEANWYHWLDSGAGGIPGVEGGDIFNFGSTNVTGNDIVTTAVGVKFKPGRHQELGFAFEFPVTDRRDVLDNRLTFDWIIRY